MNAPTPAPEWLRERLEELAEDLGRLRRCTRETSVAWRVDAVCDRIWWLLCSTLPTAADVYNGTGDVELALTAADRETRRLERLFAWSARSGELALVTPEPALDGDPEPQLEPKLARRA